MPKRSSSAGVAATAADRGEPEVLDVGVGRQGVGVEGDGGAGGGGEGFGRVVGGVEVDGEAVDAGAEGVDVEAADEDVGIGEVGAVGVGDDEVGERAGRVAGADDGVGAVEAELEPAVGCGECAAGVGVVIREVDQGVLAGE